MVRTFLPNLEDDLELLLEYGPDQQRRKAVYENDGDPLKTRNYAGSYEKQTDDVTGETIEVHYISAGGMLVAMYVIDSTEEPEQGEDPGKMYYPHQDHLGSIIHVSDASGEIVETFSYDAWGRPRNPDDLTYVDIPERPDWLWRGYTGHEHLDEFGLINMFSEDLGFGSLGEPQPIAEPIPITKYISTSVSGNGRLYDPVVGRMLSPDNYVQSPDFSQSYNRYSYVWNNPLKYTDPSGEFLILDSWINGFIHGFFSKGSNRLENAWNTANTWAGNDAKIWGGLFVSDPNKTTGGRIWEVISRFTWQVPQTLGGFVTAHGYNTFGFGGGVESVEYAYGATVVKTKNSNWGAVAQGSYIVGDNRIEADANNWLFQHEYGHYLQSQSMGVAYYARVGIPSLLSGGGWEHDFHPVEIDANRRAFLYFNQNVENFYLSEQEANAPHHRGWNFIRNPLINLDEFNQNKSFYVDFRNPQEVQALDRHRVIASWHDYFFPVESMLYNVWYYNRP